MTALQAATDLSQFEWFDKVSLKFIVRLAINVLSVTILIGWIYYKNYRKSDLFLTFFGFNLIIFFITYLLNKVEMSLGAAFGLFAVFSILRFRTEGISTKDMTYLFLVIALGLINAISKGSWDDLTIMNTILVAGIGILESGILIKKEVSKMVIYDKIELITPERKADLIADLSSRTGMPIHRVEFQEYDFLKDAAQITIYYYEDKINRQ
jgi:hypothetical protein